MSALIPTQSDAQIAIDNGYHVNIGMFATYASKNKQSPHIGGIELTVQGEWVTDSGEFFPSLTDAINSEQEAA